MFAAAMSIPGCKSVDEPDGKVPILDIHQHVGYMDRTNEALIAHQRAMGVTKSILQPAGHPVK